MLTAQQRRDLLAGGLETVAVLPSGGSLQVIGVGEVDRVRITPAEVLRPVLLSGASSYALVHTHPLGGPPSAADLAVTRRLVAAGTVLGIRLTEHLVLGPTQSWDCLLVGVELVRRSPVSR